SAHAAGGTFAVLSFHAEVEDALIVYGTADEEAANRDAAEALQRAIVWRRSNVKLPIKADRDVTEGDLKGHHLLLIGRRDCNRVEERGRKERPVAFDSRSFVVRHEAYADADTAVIAAGTNPLNPRYSVVVIAGLSAASTVRAAPELMRRELRPAEVVVLVQGAKPRMLVATSPELVRELEKR